MVDLDDEEVMDVTIDVDEEEVEVVMVVLSASCRLSTSLLA